MANILNQIGNFFYTTFNLIIASFANMGFFDIVDILIISYVVYKAIQLFRETRAKQLVKGIIILFVVWVLAQLLDLVTVKWLLVKLMDYAIIAVAIIFQPELRHALEHVGRSKFGFLGMRQNNNIGDRDTILQSIDAVCKSVQSLQENRIGALIVFERATRLGDIIHTGTVIDADASEPLICNLFFPKSPLHDGAMVLREGKVHAAGCILPLTSHNNEINRELGTRHRAAIGMSENSDALVVVVSEETGNISVAAGGVLKRNYTPATLRERLNASLIEVQEDTTPLLQKIFRFKFKQ